VVPAVDFSRLDEVLWWWIVCPWPPAGSARERSVTWRAGLVLLVAAGLAILESVIPHLFHLRARGRISCSSSCSTWAARRVVQGAALSAATGYLSDLSSATPAFLYTFLAVLTSCGADRGSRAAHRGRHPVRRGGLRRDSRHSLVATLIFGFFTGSGLHFEAAPLLWSAFGTALGRRSSSRCCAGSTPASSTRRGAGGLF